MSTTVWEQPTDLVRMPMSYEDYMAIPSKIHAEWVDGVVVMAPSGVWRHNKVGDRLRRLFEDELPTTAQTTDITVYLPRNRERRPDVVVLQKPPEGDYPVVAVDGPPILVVEVISPSTRSEDWIRKAHDYAVAGIGQYWLADSAAHQLTVLELVDGEWRDLLLLDKGHPTGEVTVGGYGSVPIDLDALFNE